MARSDQMPRLGSMLDEELLADAAIEAAEAEDLEDLFLLFLALRPLPALFRTGIGDVESRALLGSSDCSRKSFKTT